VAVLYLANQTHTNLRIGVAGFFGYARSVLNMVKGAPEFVPALHSNQSSIEALFLWIRKVGRDRASNYAGGITGRNAIHTNMSENVLAKNKMYSKEDISIEQDDLQDIKLVLGQGLKNRQRKLDIWLSSRKRGEDKVGTESDGFGIFILPPTMVLEKKRPIWETWCYRYQETKDWTIIIFWISF
jgi:hypothetical protein